MSDTKPGKVIRVSPQVWKFFTANRNKGESADALIRRLMGLPRKGGKDFTKKINHLGEEFYLIPEYGIISKSKAEAIGQAIMIAAERGKKRQIDSPIHVREVV